MNKIAQWIQLATCLGVAAGMVSITACQLTGAGTAASRPVPDYAPDEWPAGRLLESWESNHTPAGTLSVMLEAGQDREGRRQISHKVGLLKNTADATKAKVQLFAPGSGSVLKEATWISSTSAQFELGSLAPGDYFIKINDRWQDYIPTRLRDPSVETRQWIGYNLRTAVIGTDEEEPDFRIKTWSVGQVFDEKTDPDAQYGHDLYHKGQFVHPVVAWTTGATASGATRWAYAINSVSHTALPPAIEFRVLGSAALLTYKVQTGHHKGPGFTLGDNNHGKSAVAFGDSGSHLKLAFDYDRCANFHGWQTAASSPSYAFLNPWKDAYWDTGKKAYVYSGITDFRDITYKFQCYRCHYGPAGDRTGFIDPTM